MAVIIGITLALLCVSVAAYPFFKNRSDRKEGPPVPIAEVTDMESLYEAIQTLQLEHQIGKVPEELYREQFQSYRLQLAVALRDQDQTRNLQDALEAEISAVGIAMYGDVGVSIPCPGCSSSVDASLGRCPECGTALVTPGAASSGASGS